VASGPARCTGTFCGLTRLEYAFQYYPDTDAPVFQPGPAVRPGKSLTSKANPALDQQLLTWSLLSHGH
jgi:hypothetical protein